VTKDRNEKDWSIIDVNFFVVKSKSAMTTVDVFYKFAFCSECKGRRSTAYIRKGTKGNSKDSSMRAQICLHCLRTRKAGR